jgi:ferric-dicitrate binding protein FerR (iron transport regulator)
METWRERTAEQWVQALSEGEPQARDSVPNLGAITQLSSQIEATHAEHARRLRRRRAAMVGAASILSLAAGAAVWLRATSPAPAPALAEVRALERAVTLDGAGSAARLGIGKQLAAGDTLVTGVAAHASLRVADGGSLALGAFSELRLIAGSDGQRLGGVRLGRGSIELDLPKQPAGEHFSVSTPDARVTVVGTKFNVRVAEGESGPVTCVSVTHGRVRVEAATRQALLEAGQRWVSRGDFSACGSEPTAATPESTTAPAPAEAGSSELPTASNSARRPVPNSAASNDRKAGTLAEENRLFLELVRARRDGHNEQARALQRKFLTRFPESPLSAQVREEQRKTE